MSETVQERFERIGEEEYATLKFERVQNPRHPLRDVCAMLMLYDLQPATYKMIANASHDICHFATDVDKLDVTDEQIRDLIRCGVHWDSDVESLAMFF